MKRGDRYKIRSCVASGRTHFEGTATLKRRAHSVVPPRAAGDERWSVHFDGDSPRKFFDRWVEAEDKVE